MGSCLWISLLSSKQFELDLGIPLVYSGGVRTLGKEQLSEFSYHKRGKLEWGGGLDIVRGERSESFKDRG